MTRLFIAKGLSMDPLIREGDMVMVKPIERKDIRVGDILAFSDNQAPPMTAHRLVAIKKINNEARYIFRGDFTHSARDIVCPGDVAGKVIALERSGKIISLDDPWRSFLSRLWQEFPLSGRIILLLLRWQSIAFKLELLFGRRFFIKPPQGSLETIRNKFNQKEEVDFHILHAAGGLEDWEDEAVKKFMRPQSSVLDIGCGAGREALALAKQGFKITAIDIAPAMIAAARKKAEAQSLEITFKAMAASEIDFPAESFDYCLVSRDVYSFTPAKSLRIETLQRIKKCLKKGGLVFLSAYIIPAPLFSGRWCVDSFRRARNIILPAATSEAGDIWVRGVSPSSRMATFCFCHYFSSPREIEDEMKQAGFSVRESGIENILMAQA